MRAACLLLLLASTAHASEPIIGGAADAGDPAVVLLAAYPGDHSVLDTCTAVVIAPKILLTAAHCLDHPGYTYGVFEGADASAYPMLVDLLPHLTAVHAVHIHPSYVTTAPFTADIGIVELANATAIAPLPIARTAPTAGAAAHVVGYGQIVYNTYNAKRYAADTLIAAVDSGDTITVGDGTKHTCVGDSGGPAIVGGTVVGVDSYSDTTGCTDPSHFRRTDTYLAFIDPYLPPVVSGPDAGVPTGGDAGTTSAPSGGGCGVGRDGGGLVLVLAILGLVTRRRAARYGSGDPSDPASGSRSRTAPRHR